MTTKLNNLPKAKTEGKVSTAIIEHHNTRVVFSRIENSNLVDILITPNIHREMKSYRAFMLVNEFKEVAENLDLEEENAWD